MTDVKFLLLHSNTWNHLTVCKQMTDVKLLLLQSNTWKHLFVYKKKMCSDSFKNIFCKMSFQIIYFLYVS